MYYYSKNPKPNINTNWYNPILRSITTEEVIQTIQQLPNNKACGPSGISYEMLKHLRTDMISALTAFLNRCITTQESQTNRKTAEYTQYQKSLNLMAT
jgi:hypothetical protein